MNKILLTALSLCMPALAALAAAPAKPLTSAMAWESLYPEVESHIKAPEFRDKDYRLLDYGKKVETPGFLYTEMINSLIDRCSREGGGRVIIPEGTWFTGPITLKSNVNLHLEEGATLLFTSDLKEYPLVLTRWEGMDCYNYQPMIYACNEKNIALTGKGTVDGGADKTNWWRMCGAEHFGYTEGVVSQRIGRPILLEWNEAEVPVEQRKLGDGYGMRVQLVNPYQCENVLIEGVTLLRSPFWVIHPVLCTNVTVRGVHVQNEGPNGDGCDPESCNYVLIEDSYFDTGDDCIAIKSGRNRDGRRLNVPTQNVIVRNCRMKNGHGGVVIGSEISGGYRNLFVENCVMDSPQLERVIRIKTSDCRGGVIEDIYVRNVTVGQCREAVLKINLNYDPKELCDHSFPPIVQNVFLENVTCKKSQYGVFIVGFDDICNINNVEVKDCDFSGVESAGNRFIGKSENIRFDNLTINGKKI